MYKALLALVLIAFPFSAIAQETTFIGSSSFTKQQFNCVTFPGGEDVTVITKGKSRIVEKSEAKRMVQNGVQKVLRKINDSKADLREARQLLKRLLKSPTLVLPSVSKELEQTKKRIANLEKKLEKLKGQKDELKSLTQAIEDCGKIPPLTNGSNILQSGTIDLPMSGWQGYLISALHVFAWHPSLPDRICVSINGGPKVSVGVRSTACTQFNDGPGTGHPVSYCLPNLAANQRAIIIGGRAGYFHLGNYDDHLQEVQNLLSTQVDLSLPSATNPCPR